MPNYKKTNKKALIKKFTSKKTHKTGKDEIKTEDNEDLIEIDSNPTEIDLIEDKIPKTIKPRKSNHKGQETKKSVSVKDKPWSDESDADFVESEGSDGWFDKYFEDEIPKNKGKLQKSETEKTVKPVKEVLIQKELIKKPVTGTFRWTDDEDSMELPNNSSKTVDKVMNKTPVLQNSSTASKSISKPVTGTFRWTDDEDSIEPPAAKKGKKSKLTPNKEKKTLSVEKNKTNPGTKNFRWSDFEDSMDSESSEDPFDEFFSNENEKVKDQDSETPSEPQKSRSKRMVLEYSMIKDIPGYEVENRIYCSICDVHLNQMPGHPQNYTDHILKVHARSVGDEKYVCTFCNNTQPKTLKLLKCHLFRHRKMANPKTCPACNETFTDYNKWRCHIRMEKGVNGSAKYPSKQIFTCEICAKVCSSNYSLRMHIACVHEKVGRNCRWCPRIVPLEEWEEHKAMEKLKHGVKTPTTCEICGTTFASKDSAANHRRNFHRNHVVECPICHKTFSSSTRLSQHKAFNHSEKRFQCGYCNFRATYRYEVTKHITKKHKIKKEDIEDNAVIQHQPGVLPEIEIKEPKMTKKKSQQFPNEFNDSDYLV